MIATLQREWHIPAGALVQGRKVAAGRSPEISQPVHLDLHPAPAPDDILAVRTVETSPGCIISAPVAGETDPSRSPAAVPLSAAWLSRTQPSPAERQSFVT